MTPAVPGRQETATCIIRDQNLACSVSDISLGGARLVMEELHTLRPGQALRLLLDPVGFVTARIAWGDGRQVGLKFESLDQAALDKLADLMAGLQLQLSPYTRQHERFHFEQPTLCFAEEIWSSCQLLDVSASEAVVGFERVPQVTVGERADLKRRGHDLQQGRVADRERNTLSIRLLDADQTGS